MMAGNPNYFWSMNGSMHPQSHHQQLLNPQLVYASNNINSTDHPQDFPVRSLSQLLLGGFASGEEERFSAGLFEQQKKVENWEVDGQQVLNLNSFSNFARNNNNNNNNDNNNNNNNNDIINGVVDHVKQESSSSCQLYNDHHINNHIDNDQFHNNHPNRSNWPHHHHQVLPVSSPTSCVTTLSNNNFLNFSCNAAAEAKNRQHNQEHSSECNSTSTGGVSKKARVQQSSAQPALKVRKEKLGDRITALHQLVSPFGKTDTASVLSEAIGYIRFLQGQIEALSSPYMRNGSVNSGHHHHSDSQSRGTKDLKSRGLCLVPISCTENVGNDNGADYWAPAAFGGGF